MIVAFIETLVGIIITLLGYLIKFPYRVLKIAGIFLYKIVSSIFSIFVYKKKSDEKKDESSKNI